MQWLDQVLLVYAIFGSVLKAEEILISLLRSESETAYF